MKVNINNVGFTIVLFYAGLDNVCILLLIVHNMELIGECTSVLPI